MKRSKGFTIIEVMLVLGVSTILFCTIVPWLAQKTRESQAAKEPVVTSSEEHIRREFFAPREVLREKNMPANPYAPRSHEAEGPLLKSEEISEQFHALTSQNNHLYVATQSHLYEFDFQTGMWRRIDK